MDPVALLLSQLGVSFASQAVYDFVKARLRSGRQTSENITQALSAEFPTLTMQDARVLAQAVVDLFAELGFIEIRGSLIHARDAVWMRSAPGTSLTFGHGSTSETAKTSIQAGKGAEIKMTGGAQIRQNPDGSISFLA